MKNLLIVGLSLVILCWASSHYVIGKPDNQHEVKEHHCLPDTVIGAAICEANFYSTPVQAISAFASALFAGVLLFVSNRQARLTAAANATAEKSADAARAGAKSSITSEKANLVIESPEIWGLSETPNEEGHSEDDEFVRGYWHLKNYGRSPARVIDVSANLTIAVVLPKIPVWEIKDREWLEIISPNSDTRHVKYLPSGTPDFPDWVGSIGAEQRRGLEAGDLKIFLSVRVRYVDQFDKPHTVSGAWQGVSESIAYQTTVWSMEPCGPKSYWEYT